MCELGKGKKCSGKRFKGGRIKEKKRREKEKSWEGEKYGMQCGVGAGEIVTVVHRGLKSKPSEIYTFNKGWSEVVGG